MHFLFFHLLLRPITHLLNVLQAHANNFVLAGFFVFLLFFCSAYAPDINRLCDTQRMFLHTLGASAVNVCLLFYALAISKGISRQAPTCDSVQLNSAAPLEDQAAGTMT